MLNRRTILSSLFGATTTPALIAPQPKSNGTGEQRRYIMIVADKNKVSRNGVARLAHALSKQGFQATILSVYDAPEPVRVIDLSNLPEADLVAAALNIIHEEARKC